MIAEGWNIFRDEEPHEHASPLFDQLTWLKTAGFQVADCFSLQAGFAIYGAYKARQDAPSGNISFEDALRSAQRALEATSRKPLHRREEAP